MKQGRVFAVLVVAVAQLCMARHACGGVVVAEKVIATMQADAYGELTVRKGPVLSEILHFDFDAAPTNNEIVDSSLYEIQGTVVGANWTTGHTNGSYAFGFIGGTSRISFEDGDLLNTPSESGAMTMTAWVLSSNTFGHIIGGYSGAAGSNPGYGLAFGFSGTGKLNLWTGGSAWYGNGSTAGTDGNWHFVAAVVDGTSYTLYLDANVDSQGACDPITSYTGTRAIGNRSDGQTYPFVGLIDDVHIFYSALSSQDVTSVRLGSYLPDTNALMSVDNAGVLIAGPATILHAVRQGDIGMGSYTNEP